MGAQEHWSTVVTMRSGDDKEGLLEKAEMGGFKTSNTGQVSDSIVQHQVLSHCLMGLL